MLLGARGEELIKSFEVLKLEAYLDEGGIPTIGWGHTGWYSPGVHVQLGQTCTREQAQNWFSMDTSAAVAAVSRQCAFVPLNQNEFDALVSFTFNLGDDALAHSTLLNCLKRGQITQASEQFLRWDYCDGKQSLGLERRRRAEAALFLTPVTPVREA